MGVRRIKVGTSSKIPNTRDLEELVELLDSTRASVLGRLGKVVAKVAWRRETSSLRDCRWRRHIDWQVQRSSALDSYWWRRLES